AAAASQGHLQTERHRLLQAVAVPDQRRRADRRVADGGRHSPAGRSAQRAVVLLRGGARREAGHTGALFHAAHAAAPQGTGLQRTVRVAVAQPVRGLTVETGRAGAAAVGGRLVEFRYLSLDYIPG